MAKPKRPKRGHFCWCCGRVRPNERFSGRGHARHLCRECAKLGKEELAYRQAARDIDRLLAWDGLLRRNQRKSVEKFLSHPDERVRQYADQAVRHDAEARAEARVALAEERTEELEWERSTDVSCGLGREHDEQCTAVDEADIPF